MNEPPLDSDRPGCIYALELAGMFLHASLQSTRRRPFQDHNHPDLIHVKVGRTDDLRRRFYEHRRRCPSFNQKVLGYYPAASPILSTPSIQYCNRLERLVHIELTDLSASSYSVGRNVPHPKCTDCQPDFVSLPWYFLMGT